MTQAKIKDLLIDKISGEWGVEPKGDSYVNVIRTTNFTNIGKINFNNIVKREISQQKIHKKKLTDYDIIIEKSGGSPKQPVGRVVFFLQPDKSIYLCNNFTTILRPNKKLVFPKYLFYTLLYNHRIGKTLRYQNKTTGIINLKLDNYLNSKIPLPEKLEDQIRIAKVLTKAEELIAKRKESIRLLDELIKSTFLDMFGDKLISLEPSSWTTLGDKINILTDYHANGSYKTLNENVTIKSLKDYALMVRTKDLQDNDFENDCIYINKIEYNYLKKSKVFGGEIIITKIGSAGNVYLMPYLGRPVSLGMNAFLLRLKDNDDSVYIYHFLKSSFGKKSILKKVKGAVTKTITKDAVRSIKLPKITPKERQKFKLIVEKIESIKTKYQTSLTELENLYGSLSQSAFKGELDLSRVEVEIPQAIQEEKKLKNFQKMQVLGAVINNLEQDNQFYGEMILAKYLYLLDKLFNIKTGFKYKQWHFGPYDPELKKLLNSKQGFFKREKQYYYSLLKKDKLFKYDNVAVDKINKEFPKLLNVFNRYGNIDERKNKIELLASVCKVVEDLKTTKVDEVLQGMNKWKTDIKKTGFSSKGEKFSKTEIERSLKFIIDKGFDKRLLN